MKLENTGQSTDKNVGPFIEQIGVPKENRTGENRIAATPDSVKRLTKAGFRVAIEHGAGELSGFDDSEYQVAGADLVTAAEAWGKKIVLKVMPPSIREASQLKVKAY